MVFVWGHQDRPQIDALTRDSDYTCPKCDYRGHLVVAHVFRQDRIYWAIPIGGWRNAGGILVCPVCPNKFELSKRRFRKVETVDAGSEFEAACRAIDEAVGLRKNS